MSNDYTRKKSTIGFQLSSIVSVSLLLFLIGLIITSVMLTNNACNNMRREVGFVVKMYNNPSQEDVDELDETLKTLDGINTVTFTSAEDVLIEERAYNPELLNLIGFNPYSPEYEVYLKPDYVNADSINAIVQRLEMMSLVEEVYMQPDIADNVNEILGRVNIYLILFASVLLLISFTLIFNTMKVAVYTRRFIIHNMKLVGATNAFILRPFVLSGVFIGVVSSMIGFGLLMLLKWYSSTLDYDLLFAVPWSQYLVVFGILIIVGLLICITASYYAAERYLKKPYDELFG